MSKVSIVVPIYNAEKYLDKCIKSILKQTFKDVELILVNDGSTDESLNICKKYQNSDPRILLIDKENEGCTFARRSGIEASNSPFITFVDADDWIEKNAIKTLYEEITEYNLDIVVCNMYRVLGSGKLFKKKNRSYYFGKDKIYNKDEIKKELVVAYFHGHPFPANLWGKLYKRDLLLNSGNYLENIRFLGEDLFYNMEMLLKTNRLKVIDIPLYYYRYGGFTSNYMPFLFSDAVNGYSIQKNVIDIHYEYTKQTEYNAISIMLLNTLKTTIFNLFNSKLTEMEKREKIREFISDKSIIECASNNGSIKYFDSEFLESIKIKNIDYLYGIGEEWRRSKKRRFKNVIFDGLTKINLF